MCNQGLCVHPENPRCFLYRGQPFKILTSAEHYGAVINGDFDYDVYLREMQSTGQNMTRVFTFYRETPSCISAIGPADSLAPMPEASVMPWERVPGGATAADGLPKFDLDLWNIRYFERLKDFVTKCGQRGIVCEIVLFCNPYDELKLSLFPCSKFSNINGVGTDLDNPETFMTLDATSIVAFQERFVRKIATELNEFDNVYYEICNEPNVLGPHVSEEKEAKIIAWHTLLARVLRQTEANLPKRHLIAANAYLHVKVRDAGGVAIVRHEDESYASNPDIDVVNYHYVSSKVVVRGSRFIKLPSYKPEAGLIWHFLRQRDHFGKPIVFDETFSGIVRGFPEQYTINRAEAWEMILSGGAGYNNLDWSFTPADETGNGKAPIGDGRRLDGHRLREWFGILRQFLCEQELTALVPAVDLVIGPLSRYGYAASTTGNGRYILYLVNERVYHLEPCKPKKLSVTANLPPGRYTVQTFDPKTGATATLPALNGQESDRLNIPPFDEDIAIILDLCR